VHDGHRSYWDEIAEDYEQHAAQSTHNALYDRPAVLDLLGPVAGRRILDVGCGPGLYAEELVRMGAQVVGLDQSAEMVRLAGQRVPTADFRVHDLAEPLAWLPDDSFDLAIMALVVHHLDDRTGALREVRRVLRPGGSLVLSTHHPTADWLRRGGSYFDVEAIEETRHRGWHVRYWRQPLGDLCAEIADAGFLIERRMEPLPSAELAEHDPEQFVELSDRPGFIVFRLHKPDAIRSA
jgi:ubiquinone/menaquinone biosynthesis C-methylase UbiE